MYLYRFLVLTYLMIKWLRDDDDDDDTDEMAEEWCILYSCMLCYDYKFETLSIPIRFCRSFIFSNSANNLST